MPSSISDPPSCVADTKTCTPRPDWRICVHKQNCVPPPICKHEAPSVIFDCFVWHWVGLLLFTVVKPGIYGLAFTMGKWFLTDNSLTVDRILMISSVDSQEIWILIKWWKNQPSSTSASVFAWTRDHTNNPIFGPKTLFLGYKNTLKIFGFFCQKAN